RMSVTLTGSLSWPPPIGLPRCLSTSVVSSVTASFSVVVIPLLPSPCDCLRRSAADDVAGGLSVPCARRDAVLAQLVLQHPADGVLGQLVDELDVARHREVRHGPDAVVEELLGLQRLAGLEHDADLDLVLAHEARHR